MGANICDAALAGPLNFIRTQATGASVNTAGSSGYYCLNSLHVGLPHSVAAPVGVRNLDAKRHALVANFALSHL